ncbi:MAG: alcohol dehydrogenase catalytic domain-containing protein, partial [Gammaproteobacteria bacterium]|nr:alcohol dehydrogenase catalytic domain-containing protein [Gammaproteobacteria bacterium]
MNMPAPNSMCAVHLTGHGGIEKLVYRDDVPTPVPADDEVLIQVAAAGMNNTDINTRIGWYSKDMTIGTPTADAGDGTEVESASMGDWKVGLSFPRIQGADIVGHIVAAGSSVDSGRIGQRVTCDPYVLQSDDQQGWENSGFLGADYDGGFAQFVAVPARNAYRISERVALTDAALATLPCSGGTAMNMLLMAHVGPGDIMLVTGASGGVGTFLIQLGHHLGADVIAIAGKS